MVIGKHGCNLRGVCVYNNNNNNSNRFRPGEAWHYVVFHAVFSSRLTGMAIWHRCNTNNAACTCGMWRRYSCRDPKLMCKMCMRVCVCVNFDVSKWWCHYWHRRFLLDEQEQWILHLPAYSAKLGPGTANVTGVLRTDVTWTTAALTLAPRLHCIPSLCPPQNVSPLFISHSTLRLRQEAAPLFLLPLGSLDSFLLPPCPHSMSVCSDISWKLSAER